MEESIEEKLNKINLIEMYDEIANIFISEQQIVTLCTALCCKVNLKRGNVLYVVEQKYKDKLSKYKQSSRLKWLQKNLKSVLPNPELKFLNWQTKHNSHKKVRWLQRRMLALDWFSNEPVLYDSQEPLVHSSTKPCSSQAVRLRERRKSQRRQSTRRHSRLDSLQDIMHDNSNCSTIGNTSEESVMTVIASQRRNTQGFSDPLNEFAEISISISSSANINESVMCVGDGIELTEMEKSAVVKDKEPLNILEQLGQESQGMSSQEDAYKTFHKNMQVTSTQEFNWDGLHI